MIWVARIRRSLLALLAGVALWQLFYPDAYSKAYDSARVSIMRGENRRAAELEQADYREKKLVSVGYEYGLTVRRFTDLRSRETSQVSGICLELGFADRDLGEIGLDRGYFNAKLRGLSEVRAACGR